MEKANIILESKNISKSFGSIKALKDVSLNFTENSIYGLFGRNGAGKTTLLNILSSRIFADQGDIACFGKNIAKHPEMIADHCCYMPEKHYFPPKVRVKKLLSVAKMYFPKFEEQYAQTLCRMFNLNTGQKYQQLSRGYQSIFRIVIGLLQMQELRFLTNPCSAWMQWPEISFILS